MSKLDAGDPQVATATLYVSLEPCAHRASRPRSCAQLLTAAGIARVVTARRTPAPDAPDGAGPLAAAGVTVLELSEYGPAAMAPNLHLLG